jgi:peptidoglycan/xylan/chitin deacetylase (PgdA/CDA1 family)
MTRRVLLTAAGLTLLSACAPENVKPAAVSRAATPTAGPAAGVPVRSPYPHHLAGPPARPGGSPSAGARLTRAERPALPVEHISAGHKAIALTIDDGPDPVYTPQVLSLLARYQVTATFSMIGAEVRAHPGVAREVAAAGHVIANHTWSHLDLAWLSPPAISDQMDRATAEIHAVTGGTPALFRAPYGAWSPAVLRACARAGMTPLAWSVDPRDWSRPGVASIVANIMRNTGTGSIILEHDGGGNRAQTVAALKQVIPRLQAAGYHFTTP